MIILKNFYFESIMSIYYKIESKISGFEYDSTTTYFIKRPYCIGINMDCFSFMNRKATHYEAFTSTRSFINYLNLIFT